MTAPLVKLGLFFLSVSLLAIGGAYPILPTIHAEVIANGWLDDAGFAQIVTLAQAIPGPNFLFIPLVGWIVGGTLGMFVATVAFLAPSGTLAVVAGRALRRHSERGAVQALRRAMRPIAGGAFVAAGIVLAWVFARGRPVEGLIVVAVAAAATRSNLGTLWYIAGAAAFGAIFR